MKKILLTLIITFQSLVGFGLLVPAPTLAVDILPQCNQNPRPEICDDKRTGGENPLYGPNGILTKGVQIFTFIVGITAVIMIIISGYRFMTGGGDSNSVATARRTLFYAIIGLTIAALSQAIVSLVLTRIQ